MELIIFIVMGVALAVGLVVTRRRTRIWQALATSHGLEFSGGGLRPPRLHGTSGRIDVHARHVSQRNSSYVEMIADYPPAPAAFTISRASGFGNAIRSGALGRLFESVTGGDVEVGHATFDELAKIEGDPAALHRYLTIARQEVITDLLADYTGTRVTDHSIRIRLTRDTTDRERLSAALDRIINAGATLAGGVSAEAASPAPQPPPATHAPPTTDPYDPWAAAHDLPTVPDPGREAADPGPGPDRVPASNVDIADMAAALFGEDVVSYESERRFRDEYQGRRVTWRGRVLERELRRTVVQVGEIDDPLFGRSALLAVADVVADAGTEVGDEVEIEGVVARLDYLERTIQVEQATLRS